MTRDQIQSLLHQEYDRQRWPQLLRDILPGTDVFAALQPLPFAIPGAPPSIQLARVRLTELADEIISLLASDPNATVKVTVEIDADFPNGAPDQIKRAVSENANSLGLKNKTWE